MKVERLVEILLDLPLNAEIYAYGGSSELVIEPILEPSDNPAVIGNQIIVGYVINERTEPVQLKLPFWEPGETR